MPEWTPEATCTSPNTHKITKLIIPVSKTAKTRSKLSDYDPNNIVAVDNDVINTHFKWDFDRAGHEKRIYRVSVYTITDLDDPDKVGLSLITRSHICIQVKIHNEVSPSNYSNAKLLKLTLF